jgi:hypothetical protein
MMMVVMMMLIINSNVVDDHNDNVSQRTSSRRTKRGIHFYAEEELEPEIPHSDDDGGLTFTSTTGITTTTTINTTPVKVFVLGSCPLIGEGIGKYVYAEPHEDAEFSSRKMDNIGFIQNVKVYNAFISEHKIEPDNSTNKKLSTWHNTLCQAYRIMNMFQESRLASC